MGGCASRPKDLNAQNPEEAPVATDEVTDHTVDLNSAPEVETAEESKQEEASGEAEAEEGKNDEANGETMEDEAKEDGQKSGEDVAASADETKA